MGEGEGGRETLNSQLIKLGAKITQWVTGNFIEGDKTTQDREYRQRRTRKKCDV